MGVLSEDATYADVTPIPQDDGPEPICPINYSKEFQEAHDYLRAFLKTNEFSERSLKLTEIVIGHNAANYTAWHFRRKCLLETKADLEAELKWVSDLAVDSPKNYQLWHHRREIVTHLQSPCDELAKVALILREDGKNYHAWSHRQWLLGHFQLWEGELAYVDSLLKDDIRNNSAWNQRHFVITNTTGFTKEVIDTELEFLFTSIERAVCNDSSWNYLIGLSRQPAFDHHQQVVAFAQERRGPAERLSQSHPAACLVEVLAIMGAEEQAQAALLCKDLAGVDVVRQAYWEFRGLQLAQ